MTEAEPADLDISERGGAAAVIERPEGAGRWLLLCDHASNRLPARYGTLGLGAADLTRHFAWDPGARGIARRMAERLDAALVLSTVSRLVIDCNRLPSDPDSIVAIGETTPVPGNATVDAAERDRRVAEAYTPYHEAIETALARRPAQSGAVSLCAVHTFTPVMRGVARPWHVGIVHHPGDALADRVIAILKREPGLVVGDNEPYAPADRVYHTLDRHGTVRGLATIMIEVRNDLATTDEEERRWGDRLAAALDEALGASPGA
ncbi:N-formylglutamate amidohydrolase [Prosthecodimorpha staleyi]|uniref:N-formylglutamate amidohydrolase n=1 Tax=Prosthecodimorpha staleyi TaxID=2840188 RepID=UPI0021C36928|nr:N-formylglutamate amidohydrolase [Prosthecodimorpha staleyi]